MDIAEGVKADRELQMLHMKDGDIDMYITTFKKLLKTTGYQADLTSASLTTPSPSPTPLKAGSSLLTSSS